MNIKDLDTNSLAYNTFKDLYCRDCGLIPYEPNKDGLYGLHMLDDYNNWKVLDKNVNFIHTLCPTCARRRKIKKIKESIYGTK